MYDATVQQSFRGNKLHISGASKCLPPNHHVYPIWRHGRVEAISFEHGYVLNALSLKHSEHFIFSLPLAE